MGDPQLKVNMGKQETMKILFKMELGSPERGAVIHIPSLGAYINSWTEKCLLYFPSRSKEDILFAEQ